MISKRPEVLRARASALSRAIVAASCVAAPACVADPDFVNGAETTALLDAYQSQSIVTAQQREMQEALALKLIRIDANDDEPEPVLSVDLEHADLNRVIDRVLKDALVAYRSERLLISQRVSARFTRRPLSDGLNTLLDGSGYSATWKGGLLRIHTAHLRPEAADENGAGPEKRGATVSQELILKHLDAADIVNLISSLFVNDDDDEGGGFTVGSLSELNTVFVSGSSEKVAEAVAIIRQADRPVPHVIIEALVVNIDTSSVESLAISLTDGAAGKFDLSTLVPAQTGGNIVASFSDLAANSAAITATVEFLAAQNVVEILARPYVATRSTKPAIISIVDDQFARVDTSGDDSSIITTDSITAGISMQITPLVMADQSIRIDINLEDSRFSATAGDIIIAKERSTASTSMIVKSGQTIVIGGLNSRYRLTDKSGLPWLRRVPILNLLTGDQTAVESREELVVYLTPYIWVPGFDTPLPLPGHPAPELPTLLSIENGGSAPD